MLGVILEPESVLFSTLLSSGGGGRVAERGRWRISHILGTFALRIVCLNSIL